jgi:tetratricopeptide (TPR) repeat protein
MKEKCPVCEHTVDEGAIKCGNCGFEDKLGINRVWLNTEDANHWLETVVKPYRVQEARKRKAELQARQEEAKKREAELRKEEKKQKTELLAPRNNELEPQEESIGILLLRGSMRLRINDYDSAFKDFNEAIGREPNNANAYSHRGEAYSQKGQYDEAIKDFSEIIRLDPNKGWAYGCRGWAYNKKKQRGKAIKDLGRAFILENFEWVKRKLRGLKK